MVCMVQLQLGVSAPELLLREGELDGRPCRQMREVFRHSSRESSRDGSEPGPEGFRHYRLGSWREQTHGRLQNIEHASIRRMDPKNGNMSVVVR